jgi:hypothetical protein
VPAEPAELFAALERAGSEATAIRAVMKLEDALTPQQLYDLLDDFDRLKGVAGRALLQSDVLTEIVRRPPEPYVRHWLGDDIAVNTGPGAPEDKTLVIAFCGRTNRVMLSWAHFLQAMPARSFDIVIVTDRTNAHYVEGVAGYAPNLVSLTQRLAAETGAHRYRRVICYGTSSGGLPAMRAAMLMGAQRGVGVGGMPLWAINRLRQRSLDAFDPLCSCMLPTTATELRYVYGGMSAPDASVADWLGHMGAIRLWPIRQSREHNVVHDAYRHGQLAALFEAIFTETVARPA